MSDGFDALHEPVDLQSRTILGWLLYIVTGRQMYAFIMLHLAQLIAGSCVKSLVSSANL